MAGFITWTYRPTGDVWGLIIVYFVKIMILSFSSIITIFAFSSIFTSFGRPGQLSNFSEIFHIYIFIDEMKVRPLFDLYSINFVISVRYFVAIFFYFIFIIFPSTLPSCSGNINYGLKLVFAFRIVLGTLAHLWLSTVEPNSEHLRKITTSQNSH